MRTRLRFQPCDISFDTVATVTYGLIDSAILTLQIKTTLEQHTWRGGCGNILCFTQDTCLWPAVDQYHFRWECKSCIILCSDYADASIAAGHRFIRSSILYEVYRREIRIESLSNILNLSFSCSICHSILISVQKIPFTCIEIMATPKHYKLPNTTHARLLMFAPNIAPTARMAPPITKQ